MSLQYVAKFNIEKERGERINKFGNRANSLDDGCRPFRSTKHYPTNARSGGTSGLLIQILISELSLDEMISFQKWK